MGRHPASPAIVKAPSVAPTKVAAMMTILAMASCRTLTLASGEVAIPVAEVEAWGGVQSISDDHQVEEGEFHLPVFQEM